MRVGDHPCDSHAADRLSRDLPQEAGGRMLRHVHLVLDERRADDLAPVVQLSAAVERRRGEVERHTGATLPRTLEKTLLWVRSDSSNRAASVKPSP